MQSPLRAPMRFRERENKVPRAESQRPWLVPTIVVGAVALALLFVLFSQWTEARRQSAYTEGQLAELRRQASESPPPPPTPTPACDDYATVIGSVRTAIGDGKFSTAVQFVKVALSSSNLPPCPPAKLTLAGLGYSASLDELFSTQGLDGHTALLRWQEAEQNADTNQLPRSSRWPAIQIVTQAYNAGFWELAQGAFVRGWVDGAITRSDPKMVDLYYAILRNWGNGLAKESDELARRQGLVLLRTADEISRSYHLQRGEARQDLVRFLAADESLWPLPDYSDQVLASAREEGGH